jgi:hypothetical protein
MNNRTSASTRQPPQRKIISDLKEPVQPRSSPQATQVKVAPSMGKLSISDAVGLITIRLSKLEEFMIRTEGNITNLSDSTTLIRSLLSRITDLEASVSQLKSAGPMHPEDTSEGSEFVETDDPNSWDNARPQVLEDLQNFKSDLDDVRKLVIKIQSSI